MSLFRPILGSRVTPLAVLVWGGLVISGCLTVGAMEVTPEEPTDGSRQISEFDPQRRLAELGIVLPTPPAPVANYVRAVTTGNLVFLAGHGPLKPDGGYVVGRVPTELSVEQGYQAARLTAIALLASLKREIGDLGRVRRIVKVTGMVNSTPQFRDHPKVINGCSDLLVEVFGERGRHARAAVGMASLPIGIAVEIEMVVEID